MCNGGKSDIFTLPTRDSASSPILDSFLVRLPSEVILNCIISYLPSSLLPQHCHAVSLRGPALLSDSVSNNDGMASSWLGMSILYIYLRSYEVVRTYYWVVMFAPCYDMSMHLIFQVTNRL